MSDLLTYPVFAAQKPVLYGQLIINGKSKIGSFRAEWKYFPVNALVYFYYSPAGKKSRIAINLKAAFNRYTEGRLTTDPGNGKPENYL